MCVWAHMSLPTPPIWLRGEWLFSHWTARSLTRARNMEDFVTWVDSSKIKRNIMKYRDKLDDFELEAL
jgi:hypothetical protein